MPFTWKGDEVEKKIQAATKKAIDETTAAAVIYAKQNHRWKNRTGTLEGSIRMRPAGMKSGRMTGQWGSFTVKYAIYLELGVPSNNFSKMPYLRPAAAAEYPKLAGRIKANLK